MLRQAYKDLLAGYVQPDLQTRIVLIDYHVSLLVIGGMLAIDGLVLPPQAPGEEGEPPVPMHEAVNWRAEKAPYPYARRKP